MGRYEGCTAYAEEIKKVVFDDEHPDLYTTHIEKLFTALDAHFRPHVDASEKKYIALLKTATIVPKASDVIKQHLRDSSAPTNEELTNSIVIPEGHERANALIKAVAKKAREYCHSNKVREIALITRDIKEMKTYTIKQVRELMTDQLTNYVTSLCNTTNEMIWMEIAASDHEMATIVQTTDVNVPNYFNVEFTITSSNAREKLDEQLSRPELKEARNKLLSAPYGTTTGLSDDDKYILNEFGRAWAYCTMDISTTLELRRAIELAFTNILFKKHMEEGAAKYAAAVEDSYGILMKYITKVRDFRTFDECLSLHGPYVFRTFNSQTEFYERFEHYYAATQTNKADLIKNVSRAMHLYNYSLSHE